MQDPEAETGVTLYSTVPGAVDNGLVSACTIEDPDPGLAPVMPPVTVPTVQVNVLAALAVRLMFVEAPLQREKVDAVVTTGTGFTVTVTVKGLPVQEPDVEVGTTI